MKTTNFLVCSMFLLTSAGFASTEKNTTEAVRAKLYAEIGVFFECRQPLQNMSDFSILIDQEFAVGHDAESLVCNFSERVIKQRLPIGTSVGLEKETDKYIIFFAQIVDVGEAKLEERLNVSIYLNEKGTIIKHVIFVDGTWLNRKKELG